MEREYIDATIVSIMYDYEIGGMNNCFHSAYVCYASISKM